MNFRQWLKEYYDSSWNLQQKAAARERDPLKIRQHGTNLIGAGVTGGFSGVANVLRKDLEKTGAHPGDIGAIGAMPPEFSQEYDKEKESLVVKLDIENMEIEAAKNKVNLYTYNPATGKNDSWNEGVLIRFIQEEVYKEIKFQLKITPNDPDGNAKVDNLYYVRQAAWKIAKRGRDQDGKEKIWVIVFLQENPAGRQ